MNIVGVTTCVGERYAGYLAKTLPVWFRTLDSIVIVGTKDQYDDPWNGDTIHFLGTDAFTRNGAHFNKAAALNEGIAHANPTDWILAFDSDILPPTDWREQAQRFARPCCLNSASRYKPTGMYEDKRFYPRGYFQLWHTSDPCAGPFDETSKHAGRYDTRFAERWPQEQWNDLRFRLTHLGQRAKHWYGPGTTEQQMSRAKAEAMRVRVAD